MAAFLKNLPKMDRPQIEITKVRFSDLSQFVLRSSE
jgi:hypothetical protein